MESKATEQVTIPHVIVPTSTNPYYVWQCEVQRCFFEAHGIKATWLMYTVLEENYRTPPEAKAFADRPGVDAIIMDDWRSPNQLQYNAQQKPALVGKYFQRRPDEVHNQHLILDPDALPTMAFSMPTASDTCWWGSDTDHYTGSRYLREKGALAPLIKRLGMDDILSPDEEWVGVGAQYVVTGHDERFWQEVADRSLDAWRWMTNEGPRLSYEGEYPVQAWCAEMYVTQLLAMKHVISLQVSPSMEMAWANEHSDGWRTKGIFHDAGVTSPHPGDFCKLSYQQAPFHREIPPVSHEKAAHRYVEWIRRTEEGIPPSRAHIPAQTF